MGEQIIITIGREYGSGGHEIAERIAKVLNISFYDRGMLHEIADTMNVDVAELEKYDEKPINFFLTRRVGQHSNSMEEILTEMQFIEIRKKADAGESFVLVGRCGNAILEDNENMISFFVNGDKECRIRRIMHKRRFSRKEAESAISRHDKYRKRYHNHHTDYKWGDARHYDLCVNSSVLGIEKTSEILLEFIKMKRGLDEKNI